MNMQSFSLVVVVLFVTFSAQAGLRWGVKAGANVSDLSGDINTYTDNYTGLQLGILTEYDLPVFGLGFDAALLYSRRGLRFTDESYRLKYVDFPLNLKYKLLFFSLLGIYATAGPYFSYKISTKEFPDKWRKYQLGLNFGAGLILFKNFQIGVNYQSALSNDYKGVDAEVENSLKNSSRTLSATYFF